MQGGVLLATLRCPDVLMQDRLEQVHDTYSCNQQVEMEKCARERQHINIAQGRTYSHECWYQ